VTAIVTLNGGGLDGDEKMAMRGGEGGKGLNLSSVMAAKG
jgi:hypothetical protein